MVKKRLAALLLCLAMLLTMTPVSVLAEPGEDDVLVEVWDASHLELLATFTDLDELAEYSPDQDCSVYFLEDVPVTDELPSLWITGDGTTKVTVELCGNDVALQQIYVDDADLKIQSYPSGGTLQSTIYGFSTDGTNSLSMADTTVVCNGGDDDDFPYALMWEGNKIEVYANSTLNISGDAWLNGAPGFELSIYEDYSGYGTDGCIVIQPEVLVSGKDVPGIAAACNYYLQGAAAKAAKSDGEEYVAFPSGSNAAVLAPLPALSGDVAEVTPVGGAAQTYTDLAEAMNALAVSGGTLKLLQSVTAANAPLQGNDGPVKADVTLDLDGKTLTIPSISINGDLTICSSAEEKGTLNCLIMNNQPTENQDKLTVSNADVTCYEGGVGCKAVEWMGKYVTLENDAVLTISGEAVFGSYTEGFDLDIKDTAQLVLFHGKLPANDITRSAISEYLPNGITMGTDESEYYLEFLDEYEDTVDPLTLQVKAPTVRLTVAIEGEEAETKNYSSMAAALAAVEEVTAEAAVTIELLDDVVNDENDEMEVGSIDRKGKGPTILDLHGHTYETSCSIYVKGDFTIQSTNGEKSGALVCDSICIINGTNTDSATGKLTAANYVNVVCEGIIWPTIDVDIQSGSVMCIDAYATFGSGSGAGLTLAKGATLILSEGAEVRAAESAIEAVKKQLKPYLPTGVQMNVQTAESYQYIEFLDGDGNALSDGVVLLGRDPVASVTSQGVTATYMDLQGAADALSDGGTLTLLDDIDAPTVNVLNSDGGSFLNAITVDLNGHDLTAGSFQTQADLTVTGQGTLKCSLKGFNKGILTVDGADVVCTDIALEWPDAGEICVKNGGTLTACNGLYITGSNASSFVLSIDQTSQFVLKHNNTDSVSVITYDPDDLEAKLDPYLPGYATMWFDGMLYISGGEDSTEVVLKPYASYKITAKNCTADRTTAKAGATVKLDVTWPSPTPECHYWVLSGIDTDAFTTMSDWPDSVFFTMPESDVSAEMVFGHNWDEPAWEWDGYTKATATFACKENGDHTRSLTATGDDITENVTVASTCTTGGSATYTASVTLDGVTYTDTKEKTLAANGHDWTAPTWDWAEDNSTATATFVCQSDSSHTKQIVASGTDIREASRTPATCTANGAVAYEATVTFNSKTYTSTKTVTLNATGHKWGQPTWEWDGYTKATASFGCSTVGCGETAIVVASGTDITSEKTVAPKCTTAGTMVYTATVTLEGDTYTDTKDETLNALGHDWVDPDWDWAEDYSTATASFVCKNDSTHTKDVVASGTDIAVTVTATPTCLAAGSATHTATVTLDGKTYQNSATEPLDMMSHKWSEPDWVWNDDRSSATATFTCTVGSHTQEVEAAGIDIVMTDETPATCTEGGSQTYTATVSFNDKEYIDTATLEIEPLSHSMTKTAAKAATCTEPGNDAYWYCSRCKKYFADVDGKPGEEIAENRWVIGANGHDWAEPTWAWAEDVPTATASFVCKSNGSHTKQVVASGTDIQEVSKTLPTCTADGSVKYKATVTLDSKSYSSTKTETLNATGHKWGEPSWSWTGHTKATASFGCSTAGCGETAIVVASGTDIQKTSETAANCTESGSVVYTATITFNSKTYSSTCEEELPAHHTLTKTVAKQENCTEDGNSEYYTCSVCGKYFSDADGKHPIDKDSWVIAKHHTMEYVTAVPATCTEDGVIGHYHCTACGGRFSDSAGKEPIPEGKWIEEKHHTLTWVEEVPAICTEGGVQAHYHCTACQKDFDEDGQELTDLVIAPLNHSWDRPAWVWAEDYSTATATFTCTRNNGHTTQVVASGTDITSKQITAPTCTETGTERYTATVTLDSTIYTGTKDKTIEAKGHTWGAPSKWEWASDGSTAKAVFTCTVDGCGATNEVTATVEKTGETPATCTADGSVSYKATVALGDATYYDTKTVTVKSPGHEMTAYPAKDATCTEPGNSAYWYCSRCKKYYGSATGGEPIAENSWAIAPLKHSWDRPAWVWSADYSTATATFTCTRNHGHTTQVVASGTDITSKETKAPKCTTTGTKEYTAMVTLGSATYQDTTTQTLNALGHDYVASVTDPTCTERGYTTHTCSHCNDKYTDSYVNALGHDWGTPVYKWSDDYSLVTATSICKRDSHHTAKEEVTPDFITKAPTCSAPGETVYTACFTAEPFTTQTKTVTLPIVSSNHTWGASPEWEWDDDYTQATATFTCIYNSEHTMKLVASGTDISVSRTDPTCTRRGRLDFYAVVYLGENKHELSGYEISDALGHTPDTQWHSDATSHWHECRTCGDVVGESQGHIWDDGVETSDGYTIYTCTVCEYQKTVRTPGKLIEKGLRQLLEGIRYRFGAGTHTVSGDATVYAGDQEFYVSTSGDYTIQ